MEVENLQNSPTDENCVTGIENGYNGNAAETVDIKPCAEQGSVPCNPISEVQPKDGLLDSGDKSQTVGSLPENRPDSDDVTVNGVVSNGDFDSSQCVESGITSSIPEGHTLEISDKDMSESAPEEAGDVRNESDLVSQGSEDMFFDPSPDELETEQWHEASDNAQFDSIIIPEPSPADCTQPQDLPHTNLQPEVNTENNSAFIPASGGEISEQTGEICQSDQTEVNKSSCSGQHEPILEKPTLEEPALEDKKTELLDTSVTENKDGLVESLCDESQDNATDSKENIINISDPTCAENEDCDTGTLGEASNDTGNILDSKENALSASETTFAEDNLAESLGEQNKDTFNFTNTLDLTVNKNSVSGLPCVENEESVAESQSEGSKECVAELDGEANKEKSLDLTENKETAVTETTSDGRQVGLDDTLSTNSASIDLGKFGEISLSTQLSTQMSEGAGNLATSQEGDNDVLPVDDIQQSVCQSPDTEDHKATGVDSTDPLPAVSCDQPLGLPSLEASAISSEHENISETFTGKAVGSERRSVERKPYELSPGHVEIDLSAQLENIFAGDDNSQLTKTEGTTQFNNEVFPDSPKTKSFDTDLLAKKENADSGVDNDDEFESLDKEIVMLRERYRSTQDRIQKALHDDTDIGKRSKDTKEMSPETAYAKFRAQRLGSAPVTGEKYDYGIGSTLSSKARMEKESGFRTTNYGARRIVAEQTELCNKLKNASQSFEELEEEIRSLKYDFWESQARRDRFFEDYDREVEEEEQRKLSGAYGIYGTSPEENPYLNYYLNRPANPSAEDEFEFRLPSTTRKPWSSYSRSYTEDPGMYSRRDYRGEEIEGAAGGLPRNYSAPLYQRDRPVPKDRVSSLDDSKKREIVSSVSEEPESYKPGKATSEFLRQIYAGQQSKPFSFEPDWEGDIDSVESVKYGSSKSPWKPTSQDYPAGYEPKSQQKYKLGDYDDSETGLPSKNYTSSYKSDKYSYGKGRDYGARSSTVNDSTDNAIKVGKANWDDNSFTGSMPRNVGRASKQKHQDTSSVDSKRDNNKWESKPSKYNFQYDLGTDISAKSPKSRYKWEDASPDTSTKSKYGSRSKELDISSDKTTKSKYSSKPEYSGSKSDYSFKSDYSSSKSDSSSAKPEKPFTSRFLQKRQDARDAIDAQLKSEESKTKDKPFQSRFLRKSTGDTTSLDESSKPPKLDEANPESKSSE